MAGEIVFDLLERDRRRQNDAAGCRRAGKLGDGEISFARKRRCGVDYSAAAIGEKKCTSTAAASPSDAIGIGECEQRPGRVWVVFVPIAGCRGPAAHHGPRIFGTSRAIAT